MINTDIFRTLLIGIIGSLLTEHDSFRAALVTETLETFVFSLTSLFACQERFRDSDTSLSDDEDSTPKTLQLGEKGSIGRFWKVLEGFGRIVEGNFICCI